MLPVYSVYMGFFFSLGIIFSIYFFSNSFIFSVLNRKSSFPLVPGFVFITFSETFSPSTSQAYCLTLDRVEEKEVGLYLAPG